MPQGKTDTSPLINCVSLTEAFQLCQVSRDCILYHLDRGHINFRQIERNVYLIELESLIRLARQKKWPGVQNIPVSSVFYPAVIGYA